MTARPHANRASGWCKSTNLVLLHTRDFSQCPSCDELETSCDKIAAKIIDLANCTKCIHHALGQANLISFWFTSRQVRRAGRSYLSETACSSLLRRTQCELPSEADDLSRQLSTKYALDTAKFRTKHHHERTKLYKALYRYVPACGRGQESSLHSLTKLLDCNLRKAMLSTTRYLTTY